MQDYPLVSIALATFNGATFLREQLDSVLAQDYPNLEIVAADDGSNDGTMDILREYEAQDSRVRLLVGGGRLGFNGNFARCFAACAGTLISPCDQDDVWHPQKTRALVDALGDATLVYCNSRFVDREGKADSGTMADTGRMVSGNDPRHLLFHNTVSGHAMVFRKRLLESSGRSPKGMYYDWWLAFVAASLGRIAYVDEVLVDYRRHATAVTIAEQAQHRDMLRLKSLRTNASRLKCMAELESPHQAYMRLISGALQAWQDSYLDWNMARIVWRDAANIYYPAYESTSLLRHPAFDFLLGHRLKRLIWPRRYAASTESGTR